MFDRANWGPGGVHSTLAGHPLLPLEGLLPLQGAPRQHALNICVEQTPRSPDTLALLQNCLREIRFTLEKSKPIVLVQEADVAKGGGPLEVSIQSDRPNHPPETTLREPCR